MLGPGHPSFSISAHGLEQDLDATSPGVTGRGFYYMCANTSARFQIGRKPQSTACITPASASAFSSTAVSYSRLRRRPTKIHSDSDSGLKSQFTTSAVWIMSSDDSNSSRFSVTKSSNSPRLSLMTFAKQAYASCTAVGVPPKACQVASSVRLAALNLGERHRHLRSPPTAVYEESRQVPSGNFSWRCGPSTPPAAAPLMPSDWLCAGRRVD
jgi:hypothetical protein